MVIQYRIQMPQYLNPENIFPKRLGLMYGNTLVIEYYDVGRDKFKRHPIPYDPSADAKALIDEIYKNPKHLPYLKKVDPKHLRAVLEGQSVSLKKEHPRPKERDMFEQFPEVPRTNERQFVQDRPFEDISSKENNLISNDSQVSSKSKKHSEGKGSKPEQIDDYYAEQFEDFQVSQSMEKGSKNISSISNTEKSKTPAESGSSVSGSSFSKKDSKVEPPPPSKFVEKQVIEQSIEEEYADDFQFVDEEPAPKKEKEKEKKQKEEKADKKEEKKEKKQKKEKKEKKDKSKSKDKDKPKKAKKDSPPPEIEEEFQFF